MTLTNYRRVPISILNLSNKTVTLRRGCVMGKLHQIDKKYDISLIDQPKEPQSLSQDISSVEYINENVDNVINKIHTGRLNTLIPSYYSTSIDSEDTFH